MFERKQCLALCLVLLTGCGSNGNSGGGNNLEAPTLGGSSSGDGSELGDAGVATELDGTWVAQCTQADEGSSLERAIFNKNQFESRVEYFDDGGCTTPAATPTQVLTGTFAIGAPVATSSGLEAKAIDLKVQSANGTPVSQIIYNIFYLDQAGLFLGNERGVTPELRPTALDLDTLLTRQGGASGEPGSGTDEPETPDDGGAGNPGTPGDGGTDTGGTPGNGNGTDGGGTDDGDADNGGTDDNSALAQALVGRWKAGCAANPTAGGPSHFTAQYRFTATGVEYRVDNYEDPDCTVQLSAGDSSTRRGDYTLGKTVTTAEGLQATEIDFVFSELDGEASGLERQDLVAVDGSTLYLGAESENGARTNALNLQDPMSKQ